MMNGQIAEKLISVIVPVYNTEQYIRNCVDSIKQQTHRNLEIILVDDGSTDHSLQICNELALEDKRIVVIHQENQGLSAARNTGIENARGDYLGFIDSDDYIYHGMYDILLHSIIKTQAEIAVCGIMTTTDMDYFRDKKYFSCHEKIFEKEDALLQLFECYTDAVSACNKLYHRAVFEQNRYPVGKKHEDEFVTYKLLYESTKTVFIEEKMYAYVQREGSIVHSTDEKKHLDKLEAYKEFIRFCETRHLPRGYEKAVYRYLDFKKDYYEYCTKYKREYAVVQKRHIIMESKRFKDKFQFDKKNKIKEILFDVCPALFLFLKKIKNRLDVV